MAVFDEVIIVDDNPRFGSSGKGRFPLFDCAVFGYFQYPAVQVHLSISVYSASYESSFVSPSLRTEIQCPTIVDVVRTASRTLVSENIDAGQGCRSAVVESASPAVSGIFRRVAIKRTVMDQQFAGIVYRAAIGSVRRADCIAVENAVLQRQCSRLAGNCPTQGEAFLYLRPGNIAGEHAAFNF